MAILDSILCQDCSLALSGGKRKNKENFNKEQHIVQVIFVWLLCHQYGPYIILLHITREFYTVKLICRNLYASFSHVKNTYTANQNGVQLFHVWKYNQSTIA